MISSKDGTGSLRVWTRAGKRETNASTAADTTRRLSLCTGFDPPDVAGDLPAAQRDLPPRSRCDLGIVGDDDHRRSFSVQLLEQADDGLAALAVQFARRLVRGRTILRREAWHRTVARRWAAFGIVTQILTILGAGFGL